MVNRTDLSILQAAIHPCYIALVEPTSQTALGDVGRSSQLPEL